MSTHPSLVFLNLNLSTDPLSIDMKHALTYNQIINVHGFEIQGMGNLDFSQNSCWGRGVDQAFCTKFKCVLLHFYKYFLILLRGPMPYHPNLYPHPAMCFY
jgi:hypothetical protein